MNLLTYRTTLLCSFFSPADSLRVRVIDKGYAERQNAEGYLKRLLVREKEKNLGTGPRELFFSRFFVKWGRGGESSLRGERRSQINQ